MTTTTPALDLIGGTPPNGFPFDVRTRGFTLTPSIYRHAFDHVAGKLTKHSAALTGLTVRLEDINGPKHGLDKRCQVEVIVRRSPPVVVVETDQDACAAMDRAGHRAAVLVGQVLEHRRSTQRQRGRKMVRNRKLLH